MEKVLPMPSHKTTTACGCTANVESGHDCEFEFDTGWSARFDVTWWWLARGLYGLSRLIGRAALWAEYKGMRPEVRR